MSRPAKLPSFVCALSGDRIRGFRQRVFLTFETENLPVSWNAYISLANSAVYRSVSAGETPPAGTCLVKSDTNETIGYFFPKELTALDVKWNRGFKECFPEEPPW